MKFTDILSQLNIPFKTEGEHHHSRQGWIQMDCPFCGKGSNKFHLGYNNAFGNLNCWQCGPHNLLNTLQQLTGFSFQQCKELIKDVETVVPKEVEKVTGHLKVPYGVGDLHSCHKAYLKQRGFNWKELQKLWQIQGIGITGNKMSWRVFIPIHYKGKIVSWTSRAIVNDKNVARYVSASTAEESISHKHLLYGEDYARLAIIICEGVFDAWTIGPGAVATFGLNITPYQFNKMIKYPVRAVCFDNQPAAQEKAKKLCDELSLYGGRTFNIQLNAKDANEEKPKTIKRLRKEFLEYFYKT